MKRDTLGLALYLIVLGFGSHVQCYETDTHGDMSYHAFDRSVLAQPSTLERLGLLRYAVEQPFHLPDDAAPYAPERDAYFDYAPLTWVNNTISELYRRPVNQYERNQFPGLGPTPFRKSKSNELRLKAWLMRGAVREDDLRQTDYEPPEIPPDIDPYGEQVRVFHHFYDPIFDRPLTLPLGASCTVIPGSIDAGCVKTTDWALGVSNAAGTTPSGPDLARRNHSSYVDAREAEWCGLTYKATNTVNASVSHAGARRACWATSIKALGHVLHLLQDLAQPQHVRNDRHNPTSAKWWTNPFATSQARRTYEIWTNYRSTRAEISSPEGEEKAFRGFFEAQATVPAIVTGSYPKPMFSKPIEFFTTRATDISINERRGLADFTNRNFYSEGSTYSIEYTSPPSLSSGAGLTFVNRPGDTVPTFGQLIYRDVLWTAIDSVQPAYVDAPLALFGGKIQLTTESIWQADTFFERSTVISLEQYSAHADVLIPRAIAYSAGFIDYFFRGKLEITPNAQQVFAVLNQGEPHTVNALGNTFRPNDKVFGFEKIRLRVRNVTDAITESGSSSAAIPQTSSNGKMVAVARYHRNACYKPNMSGERMRGYAPPPTLGAITEPTCSAADRNCLCRGATASAISVRTSACRAQACYALGGA